MGLFKNHKRKTLDVEIQGEKFTLTEPSAQDLCNYHDIMQKEHETLVEGSSVYFKTVVSNKISFRLIAFCMYRNMKDQTPENVYRMLCDEITDFDDIAKLLNAAEIVSGLKIEVEGEPELKPEAKDLQDESLVTD